MGETRVNPFLVIIPLLLSIVGFVLTMLALLAGTGPQQHALEDYHLLAVNMSDFGHDLVASAASSSANARAASNGSSWDALEDGLKGIGDIITDELNGLANDYVDSLARQLGISQWYSVHIMTACEGFFAPTATTPGAWYNSTNCTAQQPGVQFNLSNIVAMEISAGPLNIDVVDLLLPEGVQETIDTLNKYTRVAFVLYVLGSVLSGLSFLACVAVLTLKWRQDGDGSGIGRPTLLANLALTGLATLVLAIGSAVATAIERRGVAEINDRGAGAGITGIAGPKFLVISWLAFAVMLVALLFWAVPFCLPRCRRGMVRSHSHGAAVSHPMHETAEKRREAQVRSDSRPGLLGIFRRRHHGGQETSGE
ncbi:actin cortical patch SUR7/pH-response regulator pali [Biscogniauxia sp. FL1348]|nr:actin cortical patch SUR7/pH-response regulator pali [Biscogniauxia sp. FL1348]